MYPGFVACYDGFQEVFIDADTVEHFLTDVSTVCFLGPRSTSAGHGFCDDAIRLDIFPSKLPGMTQKF
jgi:hypothetical protein